MSRKYEIVEIDGTKYELHGVKADNKKIGFVPIRCFSNASSDQEFLDFVESADSSERTLIVADYKYGNAVRLQGKARNIATGEGYTDGDHNRIFNELSVADPDWLAGFVGKGDALDKACKAEFDRQQAEGMEETDESKIWRELAGK